MPGVQSNVDSMTGNGESASLFALKPVVREIIGFVGRKLFF